jgi:outer membrane protein assembly factor BamB
VKLRLLVAFVVFQLSFVGSSWGENWPQWRGPHGNGVSNETGLPAEWRGDENVAWKAPIRGLGVSSPIVWESTIVLTSQLGRGVVRYGNLPSLSRGEDPSERGLSQPAEPNDGTVTFLVQAFDRANGSVLWEHSIPSQGPPIEVHDKNNLATPSCTTDGAGVYCLFGTGQMTALSLEGKELWQRDLRSEHGPFDIGWGHSSSPVLHDDSLILLCDHQSTSYLLALDKRTGEKKWRVDRGKELRSYSTPMVVRGEERDELVVNSSKGIQAYAPGSGEQLWFFEEENRFPTPSPAFGDGVIFMSRGHRSGPYMAIRPGGSGDISKSHVAWHVATGAPYVTSLVYYRGTVFMVNGRGLATAVDGETGETVWKSRLGGVYSSSPVAGDGKVYLTSEGGDVVVLSAEGEPEILARNSLGERFLASPAISGRRLYFRSDHHLFAIGSTAD